MLRYSPRITKDERLAFDYFLKSARAGHPNSQFEIGRYYTNGRGPVQGNYETAAGWYKRLPIKITQKPEHAVTDVFRWPGIEQDMHQARLLSEAAVKMGSRVASPRRTSAGGISLVKVAIPRTCNLHMSGTPGVPRRAMRMPAPIWHSSTPPGWVATAT